MAPGTYAVLLFVQFLAEAGDRALIGIRAMVRPSVFPVVLLLAAWPAAYADSVTVTEPVTANPAALALPGLRIITSPVLVVVTGLALSANQRSVVTPTGLALGHTPTPFLLALRERTLKRDTVPGGGPCFNPSTL